MSIFDEARKSVSVPVAAEYYGFRPNRAGYIRCFVHREKSPSLKLYGNHWHCFGCGAGGSVIDFIMSIFDLDAMGAVRKLNADFNLCLPLDRQPTPQERTQAAKQADTIKTFDRFIAWRERTMAALNKAYRTGHLALKNIPPSEWAASTIEAIKAMPTIEYLSNTLERGTLAEQVEVFRSRKEVDALCKRALSDMPPKSGAA